MPSTTSSFTFSSQPAKTFKVDGIVWTLNGDSLTAHAHGVSIIKRGSRYTTSMRFSPLFDRANDAAKYVAKNIVAQAIFNQATARRRAGR